MQIELWSLGKESSKLLEAGIEEYSKRINRYHSFKLVFIDNTKIPKNLPKEQLMDKEAELIFSKLGAKDLLISLDEKGKQFTSVDFAKKMENLMNLSPSKLIFLIGGSFGISTKVKEKSQLVMTLSDFTFPHQLVRLLFTEQLYRAFTILKNEKYHHE